MRIYKSIIIFKLKYYREVSKKIKDLGSYTTFNPSIGNRDLVNIFKVIMYLMECSKAVLNIVSEIAELPNLELKRSVFHMAREINRYASEDHEQEDMDIRE